MITSALKALLLIAFLMAAGCAPRNSHIVTLNFPPDRSLGTVYVVEDSLSFLSGSGEEKRGAAKGTVHVSVREGWHLELRISPEGSTDFSGLARIGSNDFKSIHLDSTNVTDEGLKALTHMSGLQQLYLSDTKITGAGLSGLDLTELRSLDLGSTHVTDSALHSLVNFPNLQSLNLTKTKISDAALSHVKQLRRLEQLNLYYTRVSDAGLDSIQHMTQLRSLNLGWTKVSDAGLPNLIGMSQLLKLNLDSTKVSDAGVQSLTKLNNVRLYLSIDNTNITTEGFKKLSQYFSPCNIDVSKNNIDKKKLFPHCYAR